MATNRPDTLDPEFARHGRMIEKLILDEIKQLIILCLYWYK